MRFLLLIVKNGNNVFYLSLFCISLVVFLREFNVSKAVETFFFSISINLE